METTIVAENIKCGGCATSIQSRLEKMVSEVKVDIETGEISFEYQDEPQVKEVIAALEKMGYPGVGQSKFSHKAKSYVSCMIGRVKNT